MLKQNQYFILLKIINKAYFTYILILTKFSIIIFKM